MVTLDAGSLLNSMMGAAVPILKQAVPETAAYASDAFGKIARSVADIEILFARGEIGMEDAVSLLRMQKNACKAVLLTVEGLSLYSRSNRVSMRRSMQSKHP